MNFTKAFAPPLFLLLAALFFAAEISECQAYRVPFSARSVSKDSYGSPSVFLTVSSLKVRVKRNVYASRLLELNWFNAPKGMDNDTTSWIGLFDRDPDKTGIDKPLAQVYAKDHPEGYYRTNVSFHRPEFHPDKLSSECLGYWIGYVNKDKLQASSCIHAEPNWMYEMKDVIGEKTLPELMIPGTHNSGSYDVKGQERDTIVTKYQMCQEESIYNQLVYGIRYLDIRCSYRRIDSKSDGIWISHGFLRGDVGIADAIAQVKAFLNSTNEIVILDFHLFENGFTGSKEAERHKQLIGMLETELGDFMMPRKFGYAKTLNEIWRSGKRLLVGYATEYHKTSDLLFPRIRHVWPEKDTLKGLENYLNTNMCLYRSQTPWAAMAELTAEAVGIVLDRYGGLRKMADDVNRHVTVWFRDRWWHCSNIVATDFFLGNNIIEVSIVSNHKRANSKNRSGYRI